MESKLARLSLNPSPAKTTRREEKTKSEAVVAESWDAESLLDSDTDGEESNHAHKTKSPVSPDPPPPTPISPTSGANAWDHQSLGSALSGARYSPAPQSHTDKGEESRRPEKTTAVAGRLIAGALGIKAAKKTEEQRAYERAAKEQEIKRRNRERAAKTKEAEEEEKAKNVVWDE